MHTVRLSLGDWSNDGHGMTKDLFIESFASASQISKAYKIGSRLIGFDLSEDVCRDYEDSTFSEVVVDSLREFGYNSETLGWIEDEFGSVDNDIFADVYMFIVELGWHELHKEKFRFSIVHNETPTLRIGGYGLFN